ncbi:MAG: hypothetical protein AAGI37_05160 [Planctomycetota bacterium]
MLSGSLGVGSRTPVDGAPAWVTLEVVTGGFATGGFMAGGDLTDYERKYAEQYSLEEGANLRLHLNRYFISEQGVAELQTAIGTGGYEVKVPEEAALLVVAWLLSSGHAPQARELLDMISPYFSTLRFFPHLVEQPKPSGSTVYIQDVKTTINKLQEIEPNKAILTQREALRVWNPLYDEAVSLFLETVQGDQPEMVDQGKTSSGPMRRVQGGWPCQVYPADWKGRAADLVRRIKSLRQNNHLSAKLTHRKASLAQLYPLLAKCADDPASLNGLEVSRIRLILARYITRRGLPDSETCRDRRSLEQRQAATPVYSDVAQVLATRLMHYPRNQGIENLEPVLVSISDEEVEASGLAADTALPPTMRRRVERCLCDTVQTLIERGLITSGEVLAQVLPQVTSSLRAVGIEDPHLRQVYAAVYRVFRRRRSLLLLDLQSQVKIEELPWVKAIETFRRNNLSKGELITQSLQEVVTLTLTSFPQAILPNKLLQEIRALAKGADLKVPIVDELAADIFMGSFSPKYLDAAKLSASLLKDSLYARYYDIDYVAVEQMQPPKQPKRPRWSFFSGPQTSGDSFASLCMERAGVKELSWDPATNGMVIEQQQILTTQNLAPLLVKLELVQTLQPQLEEMARECFRWVCQRIQTSDGTKWHARLIAIKNAAYAWRQMVLYLSLIDTSELNDWLAWAGEYLQDRGHTFQQRLLPAFAGLGNAAHVNANPTDGMCFLGWSKKRHWLIQE